MTFVVLLSFLWISEGGYLLWGGLTNRAALEPMDTAASVENGKAKLES
jgi:hypothetical protein